MLSGSLAAPRAKPQPPSAFCAERSQAAERARPPRLAGGREREDPERGRVHLPRPGAVAEAVAAEAGDQVLPPNFRGSSPAAYQDQDGPLEVADAPDLAGGPAQIGDRGLPVPAQVERVDRPLASRPRQAQPVITGLDGVPGAIPKPPSGFCAR